MSDDKYMTRGEAAELLRVDVKTIDRWRGWQWFRVTGAGRRVLIERASVQRLLDQNERRERKWARGREIANGKWPDGRLRQRDGVTE